jgi:hypothetical protein
MKQMKQMKKIRQVKIVGNKIKLGIIFSITLLNLSGCALLQPGKSEYLPNDSAIISLNHIAEKAQKSNAALAEAQSHQYKTVHTVYRDIPVKTHNAAIPTISFSFKGNLDTALRQLSSQVSYSYLTEGTPPQLIPNVSVQKKNITLPNIIENINSQLPTTVRVILYQKTHTILATYH